MPEHSGFQTICVSGGRDRTRAADVSTPIYLSTSFVFPDVEEGARRAGDIEADEFYGRWGSTNVREFEAIMAALEGGEEALAAASGLAIVSMIIHTFASSGDHIVAPHACYSETKILFQELAEQSGIEVTFVDSMDSANFEAAVRPETKLVFVETPANPTIGVVDIAEVVRITRSQSDAVLVVDSTFASPYNQTPLAMGADIVMHSATKYIGGHSDVVAGVCAGPARLLQRVRHTFSYHGPTLDPFSGWLLCRGVRTLGLRMQRHNENALRLAHWLDERPEVTSVSYPLHPGHPKYDVAVKQMRGGGGMICFEVAGGMDAALATVRGVRLIHMAVSLGSVHTLLTHPASMTHNLLPRPEREKAGINDGMLRFSVGIEDPEDLERELDRVLRDAVPRP